MKTFLYLTSMNMSLVAAQKYVAHDLAFVFQNITAVRRLICSHMKASEILGKQTSSGEVQAIDLKKRKIPSTR